jgi:hypothetical protein
MKALAVNIPNTLAEALRWAGDYHGIEQALKYHISKQTENVFIIGRLLELAEKQQIHKHTNSGAKNFMEWAEKEIHLKRSTVQRIQSIYKTFAPMLGTHGELILSIDKTKLSLIAPVVAKMTDDEKITDLLFDCTTNSFRAMEANLKNAEGKIAPDQCDNHVWKTKVIQKCTNCGLVLVKEGMSNTEYKDG